MKCKHEIIYIRNDVGRAISYKWCKLCGTFFVTAYDFDPNVVTEYVPKNLKKLNKDKYKF